MRGSQDLLGEKETGNSLEEKTPTELSPSLFTGWYWNLNFILGVCTHLKRDYVELFEIVLP